jgi:hypothetical protein
VLRSTVRIKSIYSSLANPAASDGECARYRSSCGLLCNGNHPFSKVERFGHWYYCKGQDKKAGMHSSKMKWRLFTKDKELALQTAKAHLK